MMKHLFIFLSFILVASCTSSPNSTGKPLADITFQHLSPLVLNVQNINTQDHTKMNSYPDHFYVPVSDLFHNYTKTRFKASGMSSYELDIDLEEMAVEYQQRDSDSKFANFVGVARTDQYTVNMQVNLSLSNPQTGELKGRKINVRRVMSISEHVSIAERELRQMQGVEEMFKDLDKGIVEVLINDFGMNI